jgi:hypothetical protein
MGKCNKKHGCHSETALVAGIQGVEKNMEVSGSVDGHENSGKGLMVTVFSSRK